MPEISTSPSDPGITPPSTFRVDKGGHRHRELLDVRAFEKRFGVPYSTPWGTRYRVDYDRVRQFKAACIGAQRLVWLADREHVRPFVLRVPPELRAKAELGAYGTRRALSSHDLIALGWVFTACVVLGAPGLLATHERLGELLNLKACMTGRRMRRLADLGLVSRLPMYLPELELEERDETTGKRKKRPRRKGQGIAYAPTELALQLFGIDADREEKRRAIRRRAARDLRTGVPGDDLWGTSQERSTPSDARVARENEAAPPAPIDRRRRRNDDVAKPTKTKRVSTRSTAGSSTTTPSPAPEASKEAGATRSVPARAVEESEAIRHYQRQIVALTAARDRERAVSVPAGACSLAARGSPRRFHCAECDAALSDDKPN